MIPLAFAQAAVKNRHQLSPRQFGQYHAILGIEAISHRLRSVLRDIILCQSGGITKDHGSEVTPDRIKIRQNGGFRNFLLQQPGIFRKQFATARLGIFQIHASDYRDDFSPICHLNGNPRPSRRPDQFSRSRVQFLEGYRSLTNHGVTVSLFYFSVNRTQPHRRVTRTSGR